MAVTPNDFDLSTLSFLVVDDNQHMVSILREVLRAFGVTTTHTARDAADALELAQTTAIDIAIVDYLMDPLDGLDFIRLIRTATDSPNTRLPIILLTAYTESFRVREARDAGATDVLRKPISAEFLYQRIQSLLKQNRDFITNRAFVGPDRRRRRDVEYAKSERRISDD